MSAAATPSVIQRIKTIERQLGFQENTLSALICKQDRTTGATIFHRAIVTKSADAKNKRLRLEDLLLYGLSGLLPADLCSRMKKLFRVYDHDGYTVLHRAVLCRDYWLTELMLQFCRRFEIDIEDNEVLGCGNTILHLAAIDNEDVPMIRLILKYFPNMEEVTNYAGDLPLNDKSIVNALKNLEI